MNKPLDQFRSAIMFITILPAGRNVVYSPTGMIKFFPVVGLILGCLMVGVDWVTSFFWPPVVVAVLDVLFLVVVTGAFHLDGLGDTADGLFSHQTRDRALEIMKDSRSGMMGLVTVYCVLTLKMVGLYAMKSHLPETQIYLLLLIIPAYSRAAMIFGIRFFSYGRISQGTGKDLFERPLKTGDFLFFLIPIVISLFLGYKGLVLNGAFMMTLAWVFLFYKRQMGCITGDMLGALNETMEAVLFLACGAAMVASV
jgi:adenosylcobinamide-GDP ribazoletransferase